MLLSNRERPVCGSVAVGPFVVGPLCSVRCCGRSVVVFGPLWSVVVVGPSLCSVRFVVVYTHTHTRVKDVDSSL